jgi:Primosomal protein N'' (replication factor Y) - superfamily II helicase
VSDIIISSENMNEASQCANYIFNQIQPLNRFATIYAPAPTFLKKMNNRYHLHILLKYRDSQVVVKNIRLLMTHVVKKYPKARAYLQVNPINFS